MNTKTLWKKIYSTFGFWFYYEATNKGRYKILYWCCFPKPFKYFRKFDLLRYRKEL